jgi:hypothetical protein
MLKFSDIYRNPEIIGQGAYGLVVRVEKISHGSPKYNTSATVKPPIITYSAFSNMEADTN